MNLMMNAGMNQLKDQMKEQTMVFLPEEMQDKKEENSDQKDSKSDKSKKAPKKQKKKSPITRGLVLKMYSILLFHTLIINILIFVFEKSEKSLDFFPLVVFLGCFSGGIFLSLAVSNMKFLSNNFMTYIFYLILLGANIIAFICCARLKESFFELINTMLVVFSAGSLTVIFFATLVKDTPSTFWLMVSCSGGIIIAIIVMAKIYNSNKLFRLLVLFFGALAFGIYESMNSNALNVNKNSKEPTAPSMVSLPFELNVCFIKVFWYAMKGLCSICSMCCSLCPKKKRRRR